MRIFFRVVLVCFLSAMTGLVYAQQLPDPGFEDWSGAKFKDQAQPKYWNFSNVSQLGFDFNFAHKSTGRSGSALKIQDQFVGTGSIGATSPGYVALGHPWAYVSNVFSIEDATAGTYGGISWTHRPDSMVVWIKRYYDSSVDNAAGDHTKDENFNLIFYSWSGTSKGASYKAKNLSCTDISGSKPEYCVDEESDIRQALDGNECGTKVQAKQIAEGWYYEKKAYANWTRISIPIYYFSDEVPEKCNVILSAGNYPNFRANSGQNAGSTMEVDDIQLIYSSKIQKLYVNGREWKNFDPNSLEQTYSLGQGATKIPEVYAVRGAGSLTNEHDGKANFSGRRLSASECAVSYGQVDGAPTTITVTAEDGSSSTTYTIHFISAASNNARLSDIRVNGQSISGFNAYLTSYNVSLPYGSTDAPVVEATAQDGSASVAITQAGSTTGQATIVVTAGDGSTKQTYTVHFSVAALTDVTLQGIYADGVLLPGFTPSKSSYVLSLPLGTTSAPSITWQSAYAEGVQSVQLLTNTLDGGAEIKVSIPGTTTAKTYKIKYKIEASSYTYLSGIALDGTPLEGFAPEKLAYTVTLPMGTVSLPAVTWTAGDAYQTITLTEGGVDGLTSIEVKAASGAVSTYRLTFKTEKSSNNALSGIALDGAPLDPFNPDTLNYTVLLPAGTNALPVITWTTGDAYQKVSLLSNTAQMTARLTVTAGDGSTRVYKLAFEVEKYANAFLQMIYLDGKEMAEFVPEKLDYSLVWASATMPKVTVLTNPGQVISISTPATYGVVRIVVTPEGGTPNTYSVRLNSPDEVKMPAFPEEAFPVSDNAQLAALYIGGQPYEAFKADVYNYTYELPWRTYQVPAVVPVAAAKGQTVTVAHGAVNQPTVITVLAADKKSEKTYTVLFSAPKSSNTALASVDIDGLNFEFNPAVTTYTDLVLPYGTTQAPSLIVERAEPEQALTVTEAPLGQPSTVVVTAEDGTQATYSFSYRVAYPEKANELQAIVVDGVGLLDMEQGPDFTLDLPYGTASLEIVSFTKNYPEQEVTVLNGGLYTPTTITVKSLNPAEPDKVYTITPNVYPYDRAMLLEMQVDSVPMNTFRPDVYNYVLSVESNVPKITFTPQADVKLDTVANDKQVRIFVSYGDYAHEYTVTFYYRNDLAGIDFDFENWKSYTNSHVNKTGSCPSGWYAPINAATSGGTVDYNPSDYLASESSRKTQGNRSAKLKTDYLLASAESMPGFLSLSQPTVTVGSWYWIKHTSSSLTFGSPIPFRNTPDQLQLDYNLDDYNKVTGWRVIYKANRQNQVSYSQNFSDLSKNKWYTLEQDISYDEGFVPEDLDILISAAQSDNLPDYYISVNGANTSNRFTSTMYVDNLRLNYSSVLKGLTVSDSVAKLNGKTFSVTLDADYYGEPQLVFSHAVPDQMPVVNSWSDETDGVRTATITNYAEDCTSSTTYTLTVTRPKSTNTACSYSLNGRDLTVTKGSPYQTIGITTNDTAYVITVTAESGAKRVIYAAWTAASGEAPAHVTSVEAANPLTGISTARLLHLEEQPVVNYTREYALDSVAMTVTDTCYFLRVFGADADTTYIIDRNASSNALLASMSANEVSVPDFYEDTYDYVVTLPSLDDFKAVAQDPDADVEHVFVPIDNDNTAVFVQVKAADGKTCKRYSLLIHLRTPAHEAYLTSVTMDDTPLAGFLSDKYDYTVELPTGSAIPQTACVACAGATVETATQRNGASAVVTFTVTSEDALATQTYTLNLHVLPSEESSLSGLFIGDGSLDGFSADQYTYEVELPYGTTELPEIDFILADKHSTATVTKNDMTVTVTVTAEDGVHTRTYTVRFTVAKSDNADLKTIMLDGTALPNFFAGEYTYSVQLPYGAALPAVTAETEDENAVMAIEGNTITVTAEDGVTTHTYTLSFTFAPSENAFLTAISLDSVLLKDFDPEEFDYQDTVLYGHPMPLVTWTLADEQQQVDTAWTDNTQLTITVTAGDGMTISEYTLTFVHMLSSNCYLSDLQLRGVTVEGFRRDSFEYAVVYPAGTDSTALLGIGDIKALPEEPDAVIELKTENNVLQIFVTAPDGTILVYTVSQTILLSAEARLQMIWLDGQELRDFDPDSLSYTVTLAQGAMLPQITAETLDTLAKWEEGMETEVENGKQVELYGIAEDGTVRTYTLSFVYANWAPSGTVDADDYLFFYAGNGIYKAVTIGIGVQVAVYDANGSLQLLETLPVADPSDVTVETDADGAQRLMQADAGVNGVSFKPVRGKIYFYVFYDSKTKRIAKGGKFMLQN